MSKNGQFFAGYTSWDSDSSDTMIKRNCSKEDDGTETMSSCAEEKTLDHRLQRVH